MWKKLFNKKKEKRKKKCGKGLQQVMSCEQVKKIQVCFLVFTAEILFYKLREILGYLLLAFTLYRG